MRSLVLAVALSLTAALAVVAATAVAGPEARPAGSIEAGSTWVAVASTPEATTTTLADVEIKGIPLTAGTEPEVRTPAESSTPSTTQPAPTAAPAPTTSPTTSTPIPTTTVAAAPTTAAPTTTASEASFDYSYSSALVSLANSSRAAHGLAPLTWSDTLSSAASSAAIRMANEGSLSHSDLQPLLGPFSVLGENIGRGYTAPADIHAAWMGSGSHRDNLLKPAFTHVGIAVWIDASGQPWVSQVFGG
ncbi:MAG: CAP domain-containing protein [Acidimicrobiia bacterium]|jgi:uncharacterized protein YkwD|nr:MAG: CAP domain-containing protein [Acidimicrobiia bacterium]